MKLISILIILLTLVSCSKVSPRQEEIENINIEDSVLIGSRYIKNQNFDVFQMEPWYIYDEENHIIWPNFNIYVLRIDGKYFKIQLIDYYDKSNTPGSYTLRIEEEGNAAYEWKFNAAACGNVYTNPNYDKCFNNPDQNIFTYLNLNSQKVFKLNAQQAKNSSAWHIAFNGTNIKINSGANGPGSVRVGLLYKYKPFFKGQNVDWQKISQQAFGDKGIDFFNIQFDYRIVSFFLPQGIKRVVNEPDWFKKIQGEVVLREENSTNWWILRNSETSSYTKFHVGGIQEVKLDNDTIDTTVTLNYYQQHTNNETFDSTKITWTLPTFNSATERVKWCLDFDNQEIIECSVKDRWDLKLSVFNWDPLYDEDREWKFLVNKGAFGPISFEDMSKISDGRE
jgi:hypothetical protein